MVLTIGMIVKNEGENLEKCLLALKPIRDALDTELIIVDTGSTDNTVEIAQKYADEVRHFEWVKDFAAARNKSLEGARGEWFMYVDADECFGETDELIAFFKSKEYKKYNSACYIQRNYPKLDLDGRYFDASVLRMTKLTPKTKFVKPVHEYLSTRGEPIKMLGSYVHHTGYADLGGADNPKRLNYIEILQKELEDTGGSEVITYMQLFDVFFVHDNAMAEEYCKKGISVNNKLKYNIYLNYVFMKGITLARTNSGEYTKALQTISDYFAKRAKDRNIKGIIASDIEMYALKAICAQSISNIPQMKSAVKRYNDLYLKYKNGMYRTEDLLSSVPRFLNDVEFIDINKDMVNALIGIGEEQAAAEFKKHLPENNSDNAKTADSGEKSADLPNLNNNSEKQVALTIGMIVKNEEENLERCLESLNPIREAIKTELIIVDTGSVDKTVEIAKKYADEVRHFEWVKDFSAARNASLKDAKGEWFMLIDGDEWFGDCSELIEFFKSGEYKNYNSAAYFQRNYSSSNIHGRFSDGIVLRMTKILPHTKFQGVVHECMNTSGEPIKNLSSFVHHFGYLELNNDDSEKRKRNEELLLKKLESNDQNSTTYQQLYDIYYGFDNKKAISYAQKGLKVSDEKKDNFYISYIFLKSIIAAYNYEKDYEKAAEVLKTYFNRRVLDKATESNILTDIDVYALKYLVYLNIDVNEAVAAFNKYSALLKKSKQGTLKTNDIYFDIVHFGNDVEYSNVVCNLVNALVREGKYNTALEYRKHISYPQIAKSFGYGYVRTRLKDDLEIITALKKYSILAEILNQFKGDSAAFEITQESILGKIASLEAKNSKEASEQKLSFMKELSDNADKYGFSDQFRQRLIILSCHDNINEDYIGSIIREHNTLPFNMSDIVYLSIKNNVLETQVLNKTDTEKLLEYYNACSQKKEFLNAMRLYAERDDGEVLTPLENIRKSRAALLVVKLNDKLSDADLLLMFTLYSFYAMSYNEAVYKEEILKAVSMGEELLPKESLIGYYSFFAANAFNNKDFKTCVTFMKKAALLDISLKKVSTAMRKLV